MNSLQQVNALLNRLKGLKLKIDSDTISLSNFHKEMEEINREIKRIKSNSFTVGKNTQRPRKNKTKIIKRKRIGDKYSRQYHGLVLSYGGQNLKINNIYTGYLQGRNLNSFIIPGSPNHGNLVRRIISHITNIREQRQRALGEPSHLKSLENFKIMKAHFNSKYPPVKRFTQPFIIKRYPYGVGSNRERYPKMNEPYVNVTAAFV